MSNLRKWSQTATGNASVAGGSNTINFAEGQSPGSVNNSARELMAQVRGVYTPANWGWVEFSATASVATQTTFKITGNQTTDYSTGRRWRLKSGSSTRYGSIVSSSYTTETTVTVTVDSGSLSASHSLVAVAAIDSIHLPKVTNSQVIEVTDNTNAALRVTQLGTGLALRVEDSTNPDSSPFVVDASGNVGVKNAAPGAALDVNGDINLTDGQSILWGLGTSTRIAASNAGNVIGFYSGNTERFRLTGADFLSISTGGIGYGTGSGGAVTQLTSRTTGVTLNKTNGAITMFSAAGSTTAASFTVTNSTVAATDTVIVCQASGTNKYNINVTAVSAGSFEITFRSFSGTATDAPVLNFSVIKAVTA